MHTYYSRVRALQTMRRVHKCGHTAHVYTQTRMPKQTHTSTHADNKFRLNALEKQFGRPCSVV